MPRGSPHQMDPLSPLPPIRGYHTRKHPYLVWPMAQRGWSLRHILHVPRILVHPRPPRGSMPYLSPLACNVSSTELSGNLSPPATYQLHPYHHIFSSLRSRSNGTPLGHYGLVAHSQCPSHCSYYLGTCPPTSSHPGYHTCNHPYLLCAVAQRCWSLRHVLHVPGILVHPQPPRGCPT